VSRTLFALSYSAASSAKILPIELWRCDMKDHGSGDVRFSEALATLVARCILVGSDGIFVGRFFTAPHLPIPWYQAMMCMRYWAGPCTERCCSNAAGLGSLNARFAALAPKHTAANNRWSGP